MHFHTHHIQIHHFAATARQEFAGTASGPDYSDPNCPLQFDATSDWIPDTGATSHMSPHRHWFHTYTPHVVAIRLADNQVIYSAGIGSIRFQPIWNGIKRGLIEFHRVLHVPALRSNLLSV